MNKDAITQLEAQLAKWLPTQRWFSSGETTPSSVSIVESDVLVSGPSTLLWTLVRIDGGAVYQVPIGLGTGAYVDEVLQGHDAFVIGHVDVDGVEQIAYDALVDSSLTLPLFARITNGSIAAELVRPMGAEQSNSSLIYDNKYVLKIFRRLQEGSNPDLEVTQALTEVKFPNIAPVVATWQRGDHDLAVCQPFLVDGTDGWKLALASARDYFRGEELDPSEVGGDFSSEAERLGRATAELHLALAECFPAETFDVEVLARSLEASLDDVIEGQRPALQTLIAEVRSIPAAETGPAIRVHGDYHLGQTLRSVDGWFIFDFEGEPARPLSERTKPTSVFKDVSGMLRSFHYGAAAGVFEQMPEDQGALQERAEAWEERNRVAFREGYLSTVGVDRVLPGTAEAQAVLLRAFEVEKAIYELAYERAHRPTWVPIPQSALDRLLSSV